MRGMDDLTAEFINETSESLSALERALADHARTPIEKGGWSSAHKLMRTIKGTCGFLQLGTMEGVAGSAEKLLKKIVDSKTQPGEGELSDLRAGLAQVRYMMDHLAVHGSEPSWREVEEETKPAPQKKITQLDEQVHRATPEVKLPPPPQPVARVPDAVPGGERVSYGTLATLMLARNQLKHLQLMGDKRLLPTQRLLEQLINDLKEKLLPRTAPASAYPRPAKVLMVESGGMRFALAQEFIREVARIGTQQRHAHLDDGAMISLRGAWLPRVSLAARLGQESSAGEAYALVIEVEGERIALCVETVGELEELMLQPLPKLLRSSAMYEAAAILGDGSPTLILDSAALLRRPASKPATIIEERAVPLEDVPTTRVTVAAPQPPQPVSQAYLLFSDGTATPKAIPLAQVARVEAVHASDVAFEPEGFTTKVRGEKLRLKVLPGSSMPPNGEVHAITLLDAPTIGVVAHRMRGIVESEAPMPAKPATDSVLMLAQLDGALTEVIYAPAYIPAEVPHG